MVSRRRVRDIRHRRSRHVARDTIVSLPPRLPLGHRQRATLFFVAGETALAVVGNLRAGRRQAVRIVARDAAKLTFARLETATCGHLLGVPDRLKTASASFLHLEHGQELVDRQSWAVIEQFAAGAGKAERALEMALLTDRIP